MKKLFTLFLMASFPLTALSFSAEGFFKSNCSSCHSIGEGDRIGPDLAGLSKRRKIDWIVKFVQYPSGMMEGDAEEPGYEKPDPVAKKLFSLYKPMTMTEFTDLDKEKVKAILNYIDSQKKEPKGKILKLK